MEQMNKKKKYFAISVVAQMNNLHPQTLRYYEKMGILQPKRSRGNVRLYSLEDIERVKQIKTLTQDMGVNLAGVEIILSLTEQLEKLQFQWMKEKEKMKKQIEELERIISSLKKGESVGNGF